MRKRIALFLLALAAFAPPALADEGSPLLSVDDLLALEDSYEAFLAELGDLAVERGLLSEEDRAAWHDAQLGDFFQNGGYGGGSATMILGSQRVNKTSGSRERDVSDIVYFTK